MSSGISSRLIKLKALVPWWMKMGMKLSMSIIPKKEKLFGSFMYINGLITPERSYFVCDGKYNNSGRTPVNGKNVLELGPGDSLLSLVYFYGLGCEKMFLVDVGSFASRKIEIYWDYVDFLLDQKEYMDDCTRDIRVLKTCQTLEQLIEKANAVYLLDGLSSLKSVPSNSIGFCFSQAVIEHIYKDELRETIDQLYRVCEPGGLSSHGVDYSDHLSFALHSLRFSERFWESKLIKRAGFYTNRFRHNTVREMFSQAGFSEISHQEYPFENPKTAARAKLHSGFKGRDDLDVHEGTVTCKKLESKN